ncbi:hypothetical protein NDU88_003047 [Pleurodeles waltl]|uniref:Uncharacterized protein n=1 Tax=Pleurodeles waltl TaxID=8319 RepID=A0AAV7UZJ9_PLEWA|nr:hypothetical protein NDU88_003047 [Pleurodeles waltl]
MAGRNFRQLGGVVQRRRRGGHGDPLPGSGQMHAASPMSGAGGLLPGRVRGRSARRRVPEREGGLASPGVTPLHQGCCRCYCTSEAADSRLPDRMGMHVKSENSTPTPPPDRNSLAMHPCSSHSPPLRTREARPAAPTLPNPCASPPSAPPSPHQEAAIVFISYLLINRQQSQQS